GGRAVHEEERPLDPAGERPPHLPLRGGARPAGIPRRPAWYPAGVGAPGNPEGGEMKHRRFLLAAATLLTLCTPTARADGPTRLSLQRIADKRYSAFPDLIAWRGQLYLSYREAGNHYSRDGKIRLLRSPDGTTWQLDAELNNSGQLGDLRIGHLAVSPA